MNYQILTDKIITENMNKNIVPKLLLHACCAPCSSYTLEYLTNYFDITILYYNPNISPESEFKKRVSEVKKLIQVLPLKNKISFVEDEYNYNDFLEIANGLEKEREGGKRCYKCYELRLERAAQYASSHGFDYFTTTLSISPHKNSNWLNEIGGKLEEKYGIKYLYSDFKKRNGYKRSIELSKKYNLYRQDYCGCIYSKMESLKRKEEKNEKCKIT